MRSEQLVKDRVCQDKQGYTICGLLVEFPKEDGGGPKVEPSWNTETAGLLWASESVLWHDSLVVAGFAGYHL